MSGTAILCTVNLDEKTQRTFIKQMEEQGEEARMSLLLEQLAVSLAKHSVRMQAESGMDSILAPGNTTEVVLKLRME